MSAILDAAERLTLTWFSGGEMFMAGQPAADIFELASADLAVLVSEGPEVAVVAVLHVLDAAVDVIAERAGCDRATAVRQILGVSESRRGAT